MSSSNTSPAWHEGLRLISDALSGIGDNAQPVRFWWRDDDAAKKSRRLVRLLALAEELSVPICLAVIPGRLERSLRRQVLSSTQATVAVHGWAHLNRSDKGERLSEFPASLPRDVAMRDLDRAISLLRYEFAERLQPIFVPPWNRLAAEHYPALVQTGYKGISASGKAKSVTQVKDGLVHAGVAFGVLGRGRPVALADTTKIGRAIARQIAAGHRGPFGVMTHHKAHKEEVWQFCRAFWELVISHPNAKAISAAEVFGFAA